MATFDFLHSTFIAFPSLNVFERCQKNDLRYLRAVCFLLCTRSLVNREILNQVLVKLWIRSFRVSLTCWYYSGQYFGKCLHCFCDFCCRTGWTQGQSLSYSMLPHFLPFFSLLFSMIKWWGFCQGTHCMLSNGVSREGQGLKAEWELRIAVHKMEFEVDWEVQLS